MTRHFTERVWQSPQSSWNSQKAVCVQHPLLHQPLWVCSTVVTEGPHHPGLSQARPHSRTLALVIPVWNALSLDNHGSLPVPTKSSLCSHLLHELYPDPQWESPLLLIPFTMLRFRFKSINHLLLYYILAILNMSSLICGSARKESACNVGDLGSIPGLGRPLEKGKATHSSILA